MKITGYLIGRTQGGNGYQGIVIGSRTAFIVNSKVVFSYIGATQTNYVVSFTLTYSGKSHTDFQDISTSAKIWVKIPSLSNGTTIYITYGNAISTGSPTNVFDLYEDFTSLDLTTKWETNASGNISSAKNNFQFINTTFTYIRTRSTFFSTLDIQVEPLVSSSSGTAIPETVIRSNGANNYGMKVRCDCRSGQKQGKLLNNPYTTWYFANTGGTLTETTPGPTNGITGYFPIKITPQNY